MRMVERPGGGCAPVLQLERTEDGTLCAEVEVNRDTCRFFTGSKVTNLGGGGAFIPTLEPTALGTRVALVFHFPGADRAISLQGKVVFWSSGEDGQPRGFGVRFTNLRLVDQAFMSVFVKKLLDGERS